MGLLDFFSQEAGQARRRWLDESAQGLLDDAAYYIGPHAMGRVNGLLGLGDMLNPVSDIGRAGQAAQDVFGPGRTATERTAAAGSMMTDMASVLAPAAAAKMAGSNATQAIVDALANVTMPADDAVQRFAADQAGAIRAYHGSPHDFDRFSMDKIGTGEGAQAYGHGLYFAESEDVARSYRDTLSRVGPDDAQGNAWDLVNRMGGDAEYTAEILRESIPTAISPKTEEFLKQTLRHIEDGSYADYTPGTGRMYEVQINANPEDFLDWDRPMSEQPQKVREAFVDMARDYETLGDNRFIGMNPERIQYAPETYPGNFIKTYGDRGQTEAELAARGVPGIRYLDAGSRTAGDGSRNYVVFDENLIEIVKKYGIAGAAAMLGLSASEVDAATQPQGLLQ